MSTKTADDFVSKIWFGKNEKNW